MTKLEQLKKHLRPGNAYRRADLARWSTSVDRHIKQLVESGTLKKLSGGLYLTDHSIRLVTKTFRRAH